MTCSIRRELERWQQVSKHSWSRIPDGARYQYCTRTGGGGAYSKCSRESNQCRTMGSPRAVGLSQGWRIAGPCVRRCRSSPYSAETTVRRCFRARPKVPWGRHGRRNSDCDGSCDKSTGYTGGIKIDWFRSAAKHSWGGSSSGGRRRMRKMGSRMYICGCVLY